MPLFSSCAILYQIELYSMHSMQYPTCSLMYFQYMCTVSFFSFFLCESMDVPEGVMQLWIIGT